MVDTHYLRLLAKNYPTIAQTTAEIINLSSILNLPKGTEYFFSDLHGEHASFIHMLKSASGVVRNKIDEIFVRDLSLSERIALSGVIYYPEKELESIKKNVDDFDEWCKITIFQLLKVCKAVSSKYSRSKVRKRIGTDFSYVIDELLHSDDSDNKIKYYNAIMDAIIETNAAEKFIITLCNSISRLAVDILHIIGDIYDRGAHPEFIMDELMKYADVDIQWGNHDILWMAAAAGNTAAIANVLRIGISYNNFDLLEDGYGINLRPLSVLAANAYTDDTCKGFTPKILDENDYDKVDATLVAKMHKAIAIIQFKLEGQLIKNHPEFEMENRLLLERIDYEAKTITIGGKTYPLKDTILPTVDPKQPYQLSEMENDVVNAITASFTHSERLHRHIKFLYSHGGVYKCINNNLLYHGCIIMNKEGEFESATIDGKTYSGKAYLDFIDEMVRAAYFDGAEMEKKQYAMDFMWYLWCGEKSPLFGKDKMTTFERFFIEDKSLHKEHSNSYYKHIDTEETAKKVLREFDMCENTAHIINGHVPVKRSQGESPIKANGRVFVIDGGISKAYQPTTGIAGYTLIYNSHSIALAEHKKFIVNDIERRNANLSPTIKIVEQTEHRVSVAECDSGKELMQKISELRELLHAYETGEIRTQEV